VGGGGGGGGRFGWWGWGGGERGGGDWDGLLCSSGGKSQRASVGGSYSFLRWRRGNPRRRAGGGKDARFPLFGKTTALALTPWSEKGERASELFCQQRGREENTQLLGGGGSTGHGIKEGQLVLPEGGGEELTAHCFLVFREKGHLLSVYRRRRSSGGVLALKAALLPLEASSSESKERKRMALFPEKAVLATYASRKKKHRGHHTKRVPCSLLKITSSDFHRGKKGGGRRREGTALRRRGGKRNRHQMFSSSTILRRGRSS